ncbi:MAG: hypothetical protein QX198_07630 [Methylococcaceae bacterium]
MFQIIFIITCILFILFLIVLALVGLCIGIAYLLIYFIPAIDWTNALVPAAILTAVLIIVVGWFMSWIKTPLLLSDYDDDDEPELLPVIKIKPRRSRSRH